ncbi:TolC family protein [Meiothermus hypogaeus]|uniref:Transporter n=2 Tax=Meiothermus hypogaeus TaxID=884155 RepID=A0A511R1L8_9DEIN|nr:TolC family protein [Meiothermus hypogaeus]RIH80520.1 Outer membrane protein TolC [Meiothermus hypogaeus]GEM83503.1 transporter [Meiothermus hypogaeus NBRC 106114]
MKNLVPTIATLLALAPPVLAQGALELPQALQALPGTLDWRSADLNYESAVRQLEAAQAALGFKLSGGADYTLRESGSNLSLSGTASLGVLPWSTSADAARSAERALERAALTRRDARNTLYLALHTQYFNLRQAQTDLSIAQATLALRERQLQIVTAQNQAGTATLSDLLTTQQNLDTARSGLVSAQGALELARLTLASTLGLSPQQLGNPVTPPEEPSLPGESLEALLQRALASRSDVLRALSQLRDAEENLASAERDRLIPNASVSAVYSDSGISLSSGLNFKSGTASLSGAVPLVQGSGGALQQGWSVGFSLSMPIFDPVADSRIRTAQTALQVAQQALESTRKAAELDVRQKYQNLQTARAAISAARAGLNAANQNLRTAQARLQAGTGTSVDVQATQLNLLQAQRNLEAALTQAQLAALALQNALGQDLTTTLGGSK